jgi:hypothetical protein
MGAHFNRPTVLILLGSRPDVKNQMARTKSVKWLWRCHPAGS